MRPREQDDRSTFRAHAAEQFATIRDPAVFGAWHVIVEAAEQGWLTASSLDTMIETLRRGGGHGVEEYGLDVIDESTVEVSFIDERYLVPRAALLSELERLAAAARGEPAAAPVTDEARAHRAVEALGRLAEAGDDTDEGAAARAEAAAALAAYDRGEGAEDVDAMRAAVGRLAPDERERLGAALRRLTDWVEQPADPAGRGIDAVIARLEQTLGPLLLSGRRAERAETERRITDQARDSIARRIAEATGDDSKPD